MPPAFASREDSGQGASSFLPSAVPPSLLEPRLLLPQGYLGPRLVPGVRMGCPGLVVGVWDTRRHSGAGGG